MRLKDKSNELYYKSSVITQRKENNFSKKAVILCVENHSIIKN